MEEPAQVVPTVEPPRGMYPGRLDDKGRLKLPADFQQYFASLPEKKLFVTSLDRRIAQIYPMSVWRENEKLLDDFREDPEAAQSISFNANDLGGNAEVDGQGRILFPAELRRELGIENGNLRMYAYKGHVEVLSDVVYQEQKRAASRRPEQDLGVLRRAGLR